MAEPAILALEDGTVFQGVSVGAEGRTLGEVVFNTAMTGYQEILTDPSYYRQIVTLTYPHVGNVGTNSDDFESTKTYAAGLIIRDLPGLPSSWRAELDLGQFLRRGKTVAIAEIDTRQLTRVLRDKGAQAGCIVTGAKANAEEAVRAARKFPGLKGMDLAKLVTTKQSYQWNQGSIWPQRQSVYTKRVASFHVVAFDYGIKRNILRLIADQDCRLTVVPATATAEEVMALMPDGVFLSNGPGDPAAVHGVAEQVALLLGEVPMFGICLGHQILGLALGASTTKLAFGHHGANHPVRHLATGRVEITSQNHNYVVQADTIPGGADVTHVNLNDGTVEGLRVRGVPAFSVQHHPEAGPGPHDAAYLFTEFTDLMTATT